MEPLNFETINSSPFSIIDTPAFIPFEAYLDLMEENSNLLSKKRKKCKDASKIMALPQVPVDDEEYTVETRDTSPAHCLTRIKPFSLVLKNGISKIESMEFDAGEHKWKLIIYPDGDDKAKKADYISAYMSMVGTASLPASCEVNAIVSFFVYNHIQDNYLCFRGKVRRFHALNSEWGISKLMSKTYFTEPSNGYLFDDNCVFGAEVFVIKSQRVIENVSVLTKTDPYKREWKISDFSKLQKAWNSQDFKVGGFKWNIELHPNGTSRGEGRYISIFLNCVDFGAYKKVKATCLFIIKNMIQNQDIHSREVSPWFTSSGSSGWGLYEFMANGGDSEGLFVNDCCILEIQLCVEATLEAIEL